MWGNTEYRNANVIFARLGYWLPNNRACAWGSPPHHSSNGLEQGKFIVKRLVWSPRHCLAQNCLGTSNLDNFANIDVTLRYSIVHWNNTATSITLLSVDVARGLKLKHLLSISSLHVPIYLNWGSLKLMMNVCSRYTFLFMTNSVHSPLILRFFQRVF